jgi:hypothetical protein
MQVLDEAEVTSEDHVVAFLTQSAAEPSADAPAHALTSSPLRVASLQFMDGFNPVGIQGTMCSVMRANQPGQLTNTNSGDSADRLGMVGSAVKERFRRAKRR